MVFKLGDIVHCLDYRKIQIRIFIKEELLVDDWKAFTNIQQGQSLNLWFYFMSYKLGDVLALGRKQDYHRIFISRKLLISDASRTRLVHQPFLTVYEFII
jgi:hypothetical protein